MGADVAEKGRAPSAPSRRWDTGTMVWGGVLERSGLNNELSNRRAEIAL